MKIEERDMLLERIATIETYNVSEKVAEFFKDSVDLNSVSIGRYPVKNFINFLNRAIRQLKEELKSENYYFYPIQGSAQPIAGINLSNTINELVNFLSQNRINNIENPLNQLITYEYYFGFWHLSQFKVHSTSEKEVKEKSEIIDLLTKRVEEFISMLSIKATEVDTQKASLNEFIKQKQNELTQITNNLQKANQDAKAISEILLQSQKLNQQIENILDQVKQKLTDVSLLITDEKSKFEEFQKQNGEFAEKVSQNLNLTEEKLNESNKLHDFINGKKEDIVRLTGMAADGSLGSKFDDRQNKLNRSIKFWRWAVPIITILAIIYILIIFKFFKPTQDINVWILLGISIIKTTPALFVLFWVFRQYVKERNIQEEYAFKSAVAMTITAYSDLLESKDSNTNTSRQRMILDAIKEVHRSPRLLDEKESNSDGNVPKNIQETLKQILELIKEVKK